MITIKFSDDATTSTFGGVIGAGLLGWTVEIEYEDNSEGFPERCSIDILKQDDIVICDVDEFGSPITNSRYHVGYDQIKSITIL